GHGLETGPSARLLLGDEVRLAGKGLLRFLGGPLHRVGPAYRCHFPGETGRSERPGPAPQGETRRQPDEKSAAVGPSQWAPTASRVLRAIRLRSVHRARFSRRSIGARDAPYAIIIRTPSKGSGIHFHGFPVSLACRLSAPCADQGAQSPQRPGAAELG